MKQLNMTRILLSLLFSMVGFSAFAHDIEVMNEDGKTIYYLWTNNNTELSVSYRGNSYEDYTDYYSGDIIIPESVKLSGRPYPVTSIDMFAFYECTSLTSIAIPSSIKSIGNYAFAGCSGLISVNITDLEAWCNIENYNVYSNPLRYAHHLYLNGEEIKDLFIPSSVTHIGYAAFYGCSSLTSVTIPSSVTHIGNYPFTDCSSLTNIYCHAVNVPTTDPGVFYNTPISSATLHVPALSVSNYQKTVPWNGFGNIVAMEPRQKCSTPTISFTNGRLVFDCETEGVEFVPSISLASSQHSNQIELFSVYRFSVYAKKNGYLDSDVASVNIDLNRLKGDMNNDGAISIADAVAIVNVLLGGNSISLYYSVGTDAVTANNYTTANNAQQVSSLSAIPSTLLTVTTPGVYYILLPDQFEPEVGGVVYFNVTKLSINIPGYSVYRTASLSSGVQIKRVNVGTSGSQIDYE